MNRHAAATLAGYFPDVDCLADAVISAAETDPHLLKVMLNAGANPDSHTSPELDHWTGACRVPALHFAAGEGRLESTLMLLEAGANPEMTDGDNATPLIAAAGGGHTETIAALLRHGADPNNCGTSDFPPLYSAVMGGHTGAMNALLAAGADPNWRDVHGTPLIDKLRLDGAPPHMLSLLQTALSLHRAVGPRPAS